MIRLFVVWATLLGLGAAARADVYPRFEAQEIDAHVGNVCYAVVTADVNGDRSPDVVAVTEDAVVWYENPSWTRHDILRGKTARDNVCIQPHDIDGDGRIDFALGAGWRPTDTTHAGTLQWLGRDARWPLAGPPDPLRGANPAPAALRDHAGRRHEATRRRRRSRVAGPKDPNWGTGKGVQLLVYDIPNDPTRPDWPVEVAENTSAHDPQPPARRF